MDGVPPGNDHDHAVGQRLHIKPGDTGSLFVFGKIIGKLFKPHSPENTKTVKIHISDKKPVVLKQKLDIVDHFNLMAIHVKYLLVKNIVFQKNVVVERVQLITFSAGDF